MKSVKEKFNGFLKSCKAMKQANVATRQLARMCMEFRLWLRITANLKEIEGSWPGAIRAYMHMFKGVPRKHRSRLPDSNDD